MGEKTRGGRGGRIGQCNTRCYCRILAQNFKQKDNENMSNRLESAEGSRGEGKGHGEVGRTLVGRGRANLILQEEKQPDPDERIC